jgi:hypothetical protein
MALAADSISQFIARCLALEIAPLVALHIDGRLFFVLISRQVCCRIRTGVFSPISNFVSL